MADPRTVAAQHRRHRAEMKRLTDLATTATDPTEQQQHLVALWEQTVLAATANQTCRYRHTAGCTRKATRALYVTPPEDGGARFDRRNGRGACESCYRRERDRRSRDPQRAAAAPPEPRPRSMAGLFRECGLR